VEETKRGEKQNAQVAQCKAKYHDEVRGLPCEREMKRQEAAEGAAQIIEKRAFLRAAVKPVWPSQVKPELVGRRVFVLALCAMHCQHIVQLCREEAKRAQRRRRKGTNDRRRGDGTELKSWKARLEGSRINNG
jgi:hypothetical protein